jgi:hypothetical protein
MRVNQAQVFAEARRSRLLVKYGSYESLRVPVGQAMAS